MKVDGASLAESIDLYCEMHSMSKNDFFKKTGISSGSLSQWRTGSHNPSDRVVRGITDYVGMPIDQFLAAYSKRKEPTTSNGELNEIGNRVVELFRRLPPGLAESYLSMLESTVKQLEQSQDAPPKSE